MADISMCKGTDCPMKNNCYRYTAKPNEYGQYYLTTVPYNKETSKCLEFWLDERMKINRN